jgi:hypothetical protein
VTFHTELTDRDIDFEALRRLTDVPNELKKTLETINQLWASVSNEPKLFVYFLGGLMFGTIANATKSILTGIAVHILADITFFTLVWPFDAARANVFTNGADSSFWVHLIQALVCTGLYIPAIRQLGRFRSEKSSANTVGHQVAISRARDSEVKNNAFQVVIGLHSFSYDVLGSQRAKTHTNLTLPMWKGQQTSCHPA